MAQSGERKKKKLNREKEVPSQVAECKTQVMVFKSPLKKRQKAEKTERSPSWGDNEIKMVLGF